MGSSRFNENDRRVVIDELEKLLQIKLRTVTDRKYFQDAQGTRYCILGGIEDWHGISRKMVILEGYQRFDSKLVIAKKTLSRIDVYMGSLYKLVESKDMLDVSESQDFKFHTIKHGEMLAIKEVPDLKLTKEFTINLLNCVK